MTLPPSPAVPPPLTVECTAVRRPDEFVRPGRPAELTARLKAFATLVFGGEFAVHGIRLVNNPAWPAPKIFFPCHTGWTPCPTCSRQTEERDNYCRNCGVPLACTPPGDRRYFDHAHPLTPRLRTACHAAVLGLYARMTERGLRELRTDGTPPAPKPPEEFGAGL